MMKDAALGKSDLMYPNGGNRTVDSYGKVTGIYGRYRFKDALAMTGHWEFLNKHLYFLETEEYFFSHAPIPKESHRGLSVGTDFRSDIHTLTWSYGDGNEGDWVEPNLIPIEENGNFQGKHKLCVYGHIHGIYFKSEPKQPHYRFPVIPGVRQYGNSVLLDTGCGCSEEGYLSCLELPSMKVYTSRNEIYQLSDPCQATAE